MTLSVLVVTTVHHPDDNRIREKTVRTLASRFEVIYAARPGLSDAAGLTWVPLRGGRIRRNLAAWRVGAFVRFDVLSIHDPELVPLGILVRLLRRKQVVFDMHEDVPAQILTKAWVPSPLRRPVAAAVGLLLRVAERVLVFTVAERSYLERLDLDHPVVANYPEVEGLPLVEGPRPAAAVYVGDVTEERGLLEAVQACARLGLPLTIVGRVDDRFRERLQTEAGGSILRMTGRLPHAQAMQEVASAAVALSPLRDLPNYRRSIPTKVLEYLAIGVPVVASDLPATRSLVSGLDAVWLHRPGDASDLARCVEEALRPGMADAASRQAEEVRGRFRWPSELLIDVYSRH